MRLLTQELGNTNSITHFSQYHSSLKQMTDKQETETQEALWNWGVQRCKPDQQTVVNTYTLTLMQVRL